MKFVIVAFVAVCCLALITSVSAWINQSEVALVSEIEELTEEDLEYLENGTIIPKSSMGYPLYKQCGQSYSSSRIGSCSKTICQVGCAMSSVAMMLKGKGGNPGAFNSYLQKHGGYAGGCNIVWSAANNFGVKYFTQTSASHSTVCDEVKKGHGVIANVNGGHHWVLVTGCTSNGYSVNDPGYSKSSYSTGEVVRVSIYH